MFEERVNCYDYAKKVLPYWLYREWKRERDKNVVGSLTIESHRLFMQGFIFNHTMLGANFWMDIEREFLRAVPDYNLVRVKHGVLSVYDSCSYRTSKLVREELKKFRGASAELGADFYSEEDRIGY